MSEKYSNLRKAAILVTGIGVGVVGVKACDSGFDKQIGQGVINELTRDGCSAVTIIPTIVDKSGNLTKVELVCFRAGSNLNPKPRQPNQQILPQDLTRPGKGYRS